MADAVGYAKALTTLMLGLKSGALEAALRADLVRVRGFARSMPLIVELIGGVLVVDGQGVDMAASNLKPLAHVLQAHDIARLTVFEGAVPKELLQLVVLLSRAPAVSENEPTIFDVARDLSLWSVRLLPSARADTGSVYAEQAREYNERPPEDIATSAEELAANVATATDASDAPAVVAALSLLHDAERGAADMIRQTQWTAAFDKAATPEALHLAATHLADAGTDGGSLRRVLKRAGDPGAAALIELLTTADNLTKRRVYFDAIVELEKGVPILIEALGAWQWYVVRNAALLLGEMKATEAEQPLGRVLKHLDERVRVAATSALTQLDTPGARGLVQSAIHDSSAEVRRRAVRAFASVVGAPATASELLSAMNVEKDADVQVEMVYALGRAGSVDAVQRLIRLCSQNGAADKPVSFRIAAIEALTAARRSAALPFLRAMSNDSEPTIRATARNLIESVSAMAAAAHR